MKIGLLLIAFILIFDCQNIQSQERKDSTTTCGKMSFKIRNSFESLDLKKDPAIVSFTLPKNGKNSFLIDAGLSYNYNSPKNNITSVMVEYHRNTLIEKEINNFQIGVGKELLHNKNIGNNVRNTHYKINVKYNNNVKSNTEGIVLTGQVSWFFDKLRKNGDKIKFWNPNRQINGKYFSIFYTPIIGVEYQNNMKSDSLELKGNIFRGNLGINFTISPSKKDEISDYQPSKTDFFANYIYRYNIINTSQITEKQSNLLTTGINYDLTKNADKKSPKVKISISYNRGSTPIKELAFQEYYLLAFTFQI